jgi:hypothetical protein
MTHNTFNQELEIEFACITFIILLKISVARQMPTVYRYFHAIGNPDEQFHSLGLIKCLQLNLLSHSEGKTETGN